MDSKTTCRRLYPFLSAPYLVPLSPTSHFFYSLPVYPAQPRRIHHSFSPISISKRGTALFLWQRSLPQDCCGSSLEQHNVCRRIQKQLQMGWCTHAEPPLEVRTRAGSTLWPPRPACVAPTHLLLSCLGSPPILLLLLPLPLTLTWPLPLRSRNAGVLPLTLDPSPASSRVQISHSARTEILS